MFRAYVQRCMAERRFGTCNLQERMDEWNRLGYYVEALRQPREYLLFTRRRNCLLKGHCRLLMRVYRVIFFLLEFLFGRPRVKIDGVTNDTMIFRSQPLAGIDERFL